MFANQLFALSFQVSVSDSKKEKKKLSLEIAPFQGQAPYLNPLR